MLSLNPAGTTTTKEHYEQLSAHTAGFVTLAEHVRRELATYGHTVAILADQAIREKFELKALASYICTQLDPTSSNDKDPVIKTKASNGIRTI